ncbi:MAG TPA: TraR/DksA C4-type zinc finger protein [Candidatus Dormibacteraeota bacterium]
MRVTHTMNTDEARTRLLTERARIEELRQAANRLTADAQEATERELSSAEQHPSELASETIGLELDQSVLQHAELQLQELEEAVKRVDLGSYGQCEACGQPISEARLEAIPTARFCIDDQSKQDRGRRNGR